MDKLSVVFRRFSCLPFRKPPAYLDKSTNFLKGKGIESLALICCRYTGIRCSSIIELQKIRFFSFQHTDIGQRKKKFSAFSQKKAWHHDTIEQTNWDLPSRYRSVIMKNYTQIYVKSARCRPIGCNRRDRNCGGQCKWEKNYRKCLWKNYGNCFPCSLSHIMINGIYFMMKWNLS